MAIDEGIKIDIRRADSDLATNQKKETEKDREWRREREKEK